MDVDVEIIEDEDTNSTVVLGELRDVDDIADENNVSSPNVLSQSIRNENDVSSEPYIDHPLPDVIRFASVNGEIAEAQAMACDVENNPVIESSSLNVSQTSDDDGQTCPICFEPWDNSGIHRLVSMKCGHLFGQSCIDKWLKGNGQKCPQCNARARKGDIRVVYAKSLKVRDTAERDRAQRELEQERSTRLKLEVDLLTTKAKYAEAQEELKKLRELIKKESQSSPVKHSSSGSRHVSSEKWSLNLEKSVDICKDGNCRVMAHMDFMSILVVSQPSMTPLFPGFGLKKLSTLDFRVNEYIAVHEKQIRDVCFRQDCLDGLVLTASMDKTVKLTSVISNAAVLTFNTDAPVWSCTWSSQNTNQFFAGLNNGVILLYDTRQTSSHVYKLPPTGSSSPVVSLQPVPLSHLSPLNCGGVIAGQFDRCSFFKWSSTDEHTLKNIFSTEGPVTSLSFEPHSYHVLLTCRPNSQHPNIRHLVYALNQTFPDGTISCNLIDTFYGGNTQKLLGKSHLIQNPIHEEGILACVADESSTSSIIWDVNSRQQLKRLQSNLPVLDMCSIKGRDYKLFALLTEKSLQVYRWQL